MPKNLSTESDSVKGSSYMEVLGLFAVLAALIGIVVPTYFQYLDKAKLTLARNTINSVSKALASYKQVHHNFPAKINFTTGKDQSGDIIFQPDLLIQIESDFASIENYVATEKTYILLVRAADKKQTLFTLKPSGVTY